MSGFIIKSKVLDDKSFRCRSSGQLAASPTISTQKFSRSRDRKMEKLRRDKDRRTETGDSQDQTMSSLAQINYEGKLKLLMMTTLIWVAGVGARQYLGTS